MDRQNKVQKDLQSCGSNFTSILQEVKDTYTVSQFFDLNMVSE